MKTGREITLKAAMCFTIVAMLYLPVIAQTELVTDEAIKEAVSVTRYTPYCDECYFCIEANATKLQHELQPNELTYSTENYNSRVVYKDLKLDYYKEGNSFCWHWHRDRADIVDIIPIVLGFEQRQWATWSPTQAEITYPSNLTIHGSSTMDIYATVLDSTWWFDVDIFFRNATWKSSNYVMFGGNYTFEMDTDCDELGVESKGLSCNNTRALDSFDIPYGFNYVDDDTDTQIDNDNLFGIMINAGRSVDADLWWCHFVTSENCTGVFNFTHHRLQNGTTYQLWSSETWANYRGYSLSVDNATWMPEVAGVDTMGDYVGDIVYNNGEGGFWINASYAERATAMALGNFRLVHTAEGNYTALSINLDTAGLRDGGYYELCLNITKNQTDIAAYGYNYDWNDTECIHFTYLTAPAMPSCSAATVTATHWLYNLTKRITSDPALSMSGCIQESQWDNGTLFNDSWDVINDIWVNITNDDVLQFYGTHYLRFWCNDSLDTWTYCTADAYDVSSGGGLTTEQETQLDRLYYCEFAGCDWTLHANHDYCLDNQTLHTEIQQYTCIGSDCFWKNDSYDTKCTFSCVNSSYESGYCIDSITDLVFGSDIGFILLLIGIALAVLYIFYRLI